MTSKKKENSTIKAMMGCLGELEDEMEESDVQLLANVFRSQKFRTLLKVEKSVERAQQEGPSPVSNNAFTEARQLHLQLKRKRKQSSLIAGLIDVLEDFHIQALLATHDLVAKEKLVKRSPDIGKALLDCIRKVTIKKDADEPLGATIKKENFTNQIVIARILHGGAAKRTGLLHHGDEILEVNGVDINGISLDGIVSLIGLDPQNVQFTIVASEEDTEAEEKTGKIFMRAHFSYNPLEDPHTPCRDAGLQFNKGDILEIVDMNEPKWWQARKYNGKDGKTGIIPSKQTQEKRLAMNLWNPSDSFSGEEFETSIRSLSPRDHNLHNTSRLSLSPSPKEAKKKSKKIKYQAMKDIHSEEIMIYEEVMQIMADFERPRPILITGVAALGCDDLRRSLVDINKEKFKSPLYHATRSKKHNEMTDKDYIFISHTEMEKEIRCSNFINVEVTKNRTFGININSIKEIADDGKACVIFVAPECLPVVCGANFFPFVVFIKAPDIELLEGYLKTRQDNYLFEEKHFTDEELYRISVDSEEIENNYGHYFNLTLTITDMETTLNQLYHAVCKTATEPAWVSVR